jgi:hypothetical protein
MAVLLNNIALLLIKNAPAKPGHFHLLLSKSIIVEAAHDQLHG